MADSKTIAIFSDVHGNFTAMQAMYNDSLKHHVDEYWFVGDLFMPGPGAENVWQLFQKMKPSLCVRGNWDDLAVNGAAGKIKPIKASRIYFGRLAQDLAGRIPEEVFHQLAAWPLQQTVQAGKFKFSVAHNLPQLNMGQKLFPTQPSTNFDEAFPGNEDIAIYAHVHHQLLRYASDERIVLNPGSVGEPFNGQPRLQADTRAHYLLMTVDEQGIADLDYRHVAYDREEERQAARQAKIPYLEMYEKTLDTGRVYTHDQEMVNHFNQLYHYDVEYQRYCEQKAAKRG